MLMKIVARSAFAASHVAIAGGLIIGTPAEAQLRYTARDARECASLAGRAAPSIFQRKKLRLDQRYWQDREKRVRVDNPLYQSELSGLQRGEARDRGDIETRCRLYFKPGGVRSPFLFEWAD